ncbi:MAG: glycosyl transferase [Candidatus Poribacteria bacterium]|nr:MAG: glycosyl transferase [Candidatus Poribacteria bacterium]
MFLLLAILAKLQSPGPILYRAVRVGRGGRPFVLYKFRSMVAAADRQGPGITAADDERITPIGRWLRRYRLDELPNLWNVLKGEMSLVGPRPELPRYVRHYTPEQLRVLSVRPGITGPTQLAFRHEEEMLRGQADPEQYYLEALLPKKLSSDLEYIATRTFWKDLGYLLATLGAVARELLSARRGSPQR